MLISGNLIGCSVFSTEQNIPDDQHALLSSSQTKEGAEETGVFVIDKIIHMSEVSHEKTGIDNFANEDNLECLLDPVVELERDIPPDERINGHANSSHEQNGVFPCGPTAPQQEVHNVGQNTEHYQVTVVLSNLVCFEAFLHVNLPEKINLHV